MTHKQETKTDLYIVAANSFTDGVVVYYTGSKWSENLQLALVSADSAFLLDAAHKTIELENLIGVELVKVLLDGKIVIPTTMREKIRALGPTIKYSKESKVTGTDINVSV